MSEGGHEAGSGLPDWLEAWDIPVAAKEAAERAVYGQLVLNHRAVTSHEATALLEERELTTGASVAAERQTTTTRLVEEHRLAIESLRQLYPLPPDGPDWGERVRAQTQLVFPIGQSAHEEHLVTRLEWFVIDMGGRAGSEKLAIHLGS